MTTDQSAVSTWNRANHAYRHYANYIDSKPDRFNLTFTDLVYVKNFKGGSAIIAEPVDSVEIKLKCYESLLRELNEEPAFQLPLNELDDELFKAAREGIVRFVNLVNCPESNISGFGVSFASALLHFNFPSLVPILDRRALNGSGIQNIKVNKQNQVTNLLDMYPGLITYFHSRLRKSPQLDLRSLDKLLFSEKLQDPPFKSKKAS